MPDAPIELEDPPWVQLDEAVDWVFYTKLEGRTTDFDRSKSIRLLEEKLRNGQLEGYGSLDTAPIQPIRSWTWTEFDLCSCDRLGRPIVKTDIPATSYLFRSATLYRATALNDLRFSSRESVPGIDCDEPGFHRVVTQVIFQEKNMHKAFPVPGIASAGFRPSKYGKVLQTYEGGRYFRSELDKSLPELANAIVEILKLKGITASATVERGLRRHYDRIQSSDV